MIKKDHVISENMKVFARVRPLRQEEENKGFRECVTAINKETIQATVPPISPNSYLNPQDVYNFKYSQAFGPDTGQLEFFESIMMDAMMGFVEGQNLLIYNFGVSDSGKTYTLLGSKEEHGIIPLAMHLFFGCIKKQLMDDIAVIPEKYSDINVITEEEKVKANNLKEELLQIINKDPLYESYRSENCLISKSITECLSDELKHQTDTTLPAEQINFKTTLKMQEILEKRVEAQHGKCCIWISFVEIYNEYVYDLLQPSISQNDKLPLAEDQNGDVYVKGAKEICVSNSMEAIKLLYLGRRNLKIASTKLNYQSSRSHCIFTVKTVRIFDEKVYPSGRVNRICFCDLAGSERANKTQTTGMRLKEAGYINTSLMVLGHCLDQLRRNQIAKDKKMIPFRESKLTYIFSSHFLGNSKAIMIINVSPSDYAFEETLNVLRFSALEKNVTISDSYISRAQSSIVDIRDQWHKSKNRVSGVSPDESSGLDSSFAEELEERDEMIEKLVHLCKSLKDALEKEKKEKRELEDKIWKDVCNDYAAYAGELLDEQKKQFETEIEALKEINNKKIQDLQEELNELDKRANVANEDQNKTIDEGTKGKKL